MNVADILIHLHPELSAPQRTELERTLEGRIGVDCAEFARTTHPHFMMVKYDPDAVDGMQLLQLARKYDTQASMVGL